MIDYRLVDVAERKRQLVKMVADAPGAESIPQSDRNMIADLVISGLDKIMASLNSHLDMAVPVLSSPNSALIMIVLQMVEVRDLCEDLATQLVAAELASVGISDELMQDLQKAMRRALQ